MSKVSLISQGNHRYEGVWYYSGDPFEANNEVDATELCLLGFATRAKQQYDTRVMTPDAALDSAAKVPADKPRRPYNRRNLVTAR